MKKSIRLLIENLFDDLYDIDQESNLTLDIADKVYFYNIGDIYYRNKEPYAICCGLAEEFLDNRYRFCLFEEKDPEQWSIDKKYIARLGKFNEKVPYGYYINSKQDIKYIDDKGYENTQIIKNKYNINKFPAFKFCCDFGDDVYLPAINEIVLKEINKIQINNREHGFFWSSTQYTGTNVLTFRNYYGVNAIYIVLKTTGLIVSPFLYVK